MEQAVEKTTRTSPMAGYVKFLERLIKTNRTCDRCHRDGATKGDGRGMEVWCPSCDSGPFARRAAARRWIEDARKREI